MRRRLVAALLGGVLLVSGCGIPHDTAVEVDGPGPAAESGSFNGRPAEPPTQNASSDPEEFIRNYLSAASGEPDRAYFRAKQFIAPESRDLLREKQASEITLTVVRLRDRPVITQNSDTTTTVKVAVQQIGVLRADGTLAPPAASEPEYRFRLRAATAADAGSSGLLITELPNVLLLSDSALSRYYERRTIYFWNSDESRLVPDQRYLPSAVPDERLVSEVVKWLTRGPSDWLALGVTRLPDKTDLINNATGSDGRWEVNLTMPGATDDRLARLATQLAWSLPDLEGQLELKIQNQSRRTVDLKKERLLRPVYPLTRSPERFAVYDGSIRPLSFEGEPSGSVPVVPAANRGVVSAALHRSGDEILAALVVARADRRQQLRVGYGPEPVTVFNGSGWYGSVGRPVWLRSLDPQHPYGLVVADDRLFRFDGNAAMSPVSLPVAGKVTAVAASLDGHRIALVVGGALYVAAVNLDGGVVTVGQPRRLVTSLAGLTAVDWIGENGLVFAGSEGRPAIYETTVDGALETALKQDIGAAVTHLTAYPTNPVVQQPKSAFMYEANRVAYRNPPFGTIKRDEVLEVTPPTAGARASNPTAPLFLY
ncbi:LpqB family beta-propeller domain-containing protein [Micromonospora sp. R77]|uniref:LpqB family beta-propeller domain-containing protein n=1 Tax=Micromonospora sp. R77 TaxID=2925836 RepID=UPI001F60F150|nr:LpqB family beta-propeller domain-containing protein [Micromonospora sp. R77]MCI4064420.1 LpqB family beta-propeller domain-containing protein [Micromonospora sp. R77]